MKLSSKDRKDLKSSQFAGPDRSYPVPDASHAKNALARASQMEHEGRISASTEAKIAAKAHHVLGDSKSGGSHWSGKS